MNIRDICASLLLLALPLGVSAQAPSTDGLIAYWKFDETAGNTATDTASTNDATLTAGASFAAGQGQSGGALQLDGNTGAADVPSFNIGPNSITISAWILPTGSSNRSMRIISRSNGLSTNDQYFSFSVTPQDKLQVRLKLDGTTTSLTSGMREISIGSWQHVAATYDGEKIKLYVNGVVVKSTDAAGVVSEGLNVHVGIGNRPSGVGSDRGFQGKIDELRVYNRALDLNEIGLLTTADAYRQLPVSFTSVRATRGAGGVDLDWTVEDQRDNAGFAVERAVDGQRDFTEVGFVPAHARGDYRYTDLSAPAGRTLYYRLRQVDHDGSEMYSDLVKVNSGGGPQLQVFPNPASVSMRIAGSGSYIILDAYGRRVMEGTAAFDQDVSVADLSAGTYTLLLNQARARFVKL